MAVKNTLMMLETVRQRLAVARENVARQEAREAELLAELADQGAEARADAAAVTEALEAN